MNENFGDWYREADFQPEHETLTKRWAGIEKLAEDIEDSEIVELGRLFHGLTESGKARDALKDALFEADNAFSPKNVLEIKLLAGVCLIEIAEKQNDQTGQIAAYAAVCPTLLGRRDQIFVPSIPRRANEVLDAASSLLRKPTPSKPAGIAKIDDELSKIEAAAVANTFQQGGAPVREALQKLRSGIVGVAQRLSRLQKAHARYREDSDILWWMTGRYSRDLGKPFKEVGLPGAAILVGKELADLIENQPGPIAARAVLDRCLEDLGGNHGQKVTLATAVNKLPDDWKRDWFSAAENRGLLSLCPVTASVQQSVAINGSWGNAARSLTGVAANTKFTGVELAYQMYRECMFHKLIQAIEE